MPETLNEQNLESFCRKLAKKDKDLARVIKTYGKPPLWDRKNSYATLIHIILEQQVSIASALSAFNKLETKIGKITPQKVSELSDAEMKDCYFSRQKTGYARNLAEAILSKELVLKDLEKLSNEEVSEQLIKIKGIGRWTADIYLIMVLLRTDVMPKGDIALHAAYKNLKKLDKRPKSDEFLEMTNVWKPYRSVAARLLWHLYLSEKKSK